MAELKSRLRICQKILSDLVMNGIGYGVRIMEMLATTATTTSIKVQVIIAFNKNLSFVFT